MGWLAHGLVLTVVLVVGALGASASSQPAERTSVAVAQTSQPNAEQPPTVASATVPFASESKTTTSEGKTPTPFAPEVERWRPASRDAAGVVQRLTGVRLDEDLLLALVAVESEGQADASSVRGAVGLAQLEPSTFSDLQERYGAALRGSIRDPGVNMRAGALYLVECARYLKVDPTSARDLPIILHAYSFGPEATARWRRNGASDPLPLETVEHATRIMSAYRGAHS
jgi:soluble lytic murein transglycosylase-like protein